MEHMFPDYPSSLSYRPPLDPNNYALLGDKSQFNITERGTVVFTMNRRYVLVRNALHVPYLHTTLYTTQHHHTQPGCSYYNNYTVGNLLLFPTMVINMESTTKNIVSFRPHWPLPQRLQNKLRGTFPI